MRFPIQAAFLILVIPFSIGIANAQSDVMIQSRVPKAAMGDETSKPDRNKDGVYFLLKPPTKSKFVTASEPIWLEAWLERDPGKDLTVTFGDPLQNIVITVEESGKPVPMTQYGRFRNSHSPHIGESLVQLGSDESFRYALHINRMYDLSRPGKYAVRYLTYYKDQAGKTTKIESNKIEIEIVAPSTPTWLTPALEDNP